MVGMAYLTYEVGGFTKYIDEQKAVATRNSGYTAGAEITIKPFGPHYNVAQGFCIPIPPDLVVDYTIVPGLKNTSIFKVKLGSLVYPTQASGFPPTELYLFMEQYRNEGKLGEPIRIPVRHLHLQIGELSGRCRGA